MRSPSAAGVLRSDRPSLPVLATYRFAGRAEGGTGVGIGGAVGVRGGGIGVDTVVCTVAGGEVAKTIGAGLTGTGVGVGRNEIEQAVSNGATTSMGSRWARARAAGLMIAAP
jgi:hypothetical protein